MSESVDVPAPMLAELRRVCLALPDAIEEQAWRGVRWRVRTRTFAHVLTIDEHGPPAYTRAVAADGVRTLLTFRCPGDELDALIRSGHPFFKPQWGADVVGMVLDGDVDWTEVAELLTESYCVLAPKKLVALVDRPGL